jgi:hypothetical protein
MTKYGLLIGCNYNGTENQLYGCINDTKNVYNILTTQLGYEAENIIMLNDSDPNDHLAMPTRANIINNINKLISSMKSTDHAFIQYSGHGSQSRDLNNDEKSGYDQCIIPIDYYSSGEIIDDDIYKMLAKAPAGSQIFFLADCCHSGSVCDLRYTIDVTKKLRTGRNVYQERITIDNHYEETEANVIMLSGCRDSQTSADATINSKSQGALTWSFTVTLAATNYQPTVGQLLGECRRLLASSGYEQIPQLSSGKRIDSSTTIWF